MEAERMQGQVGRVERIFVCSHCGYAPGNRQNWCNGGCGSDYNEMRAVEVIPLATLDALAEEFDKRADETEKAVAPFPGMSAAKAAIAAYRRAAELVRSRIAGEGGER